jgi:hypothetical protein
VRPALLAALLASLVLAPGAAATTAPELIVGVSVSLTSRTVQLSTKQVARGNYVEFRVRNRTAHRHLFTMAGRTIVVPARKLRLLAIMFDVRGTYRYVSRGDGNAVRGTFRVS